MKWLSLISIVLQFLAFWFAAPELLGEKAIRRLEINLQNFISTLPSVLLLGVVLAYAISLSVTGIALGISGSELGMTKEDMYQYMISLLICCLVYLVFLIRYKRIKNWLAINLAMPLMKKLIENSEFRFTSLKIGAVLFTLGFVAQVVLVFLS